MFQSFRWLRVDAGLLWPSEHFHKGRANNNQIPSNMLITRIQPGIYMSAWMLVWAVVSGKLVSCVHWCALSDSECITHTTTMPGCTALVQNYRGLVACRFFLGITEAPVSCLSICGTVP